MGEFPTQHTHAILDTGNLSKSLIAPYEMLNGLVAVVISWKAWYEALV